LEEVHADVGRHFKCAQLEEAELEAGAIGRIELVDTELCAVGVAGDVGEEIAKEAVKEGGAGVFFFGEISEGYFEFVERVGAGFVDARVLAGRSDVGAGEEVGEGRMILPEGKEADEEVGPAEQRAVRDGRATNDDVAAAASGLEIAVAGEFAGGEAMFEGFFVEEGVDGLELVPVFCGGQVDFEDAGVGGGAEVLDAGVGGGSVAFEPDGHPEVAAGVFDGGD
jgi:hypothetical protein